MDFTPDPSHEVLVYCLTRDHDLADAVERRVSRALAFFYNDAARLHQAVVLRRPDLVVVDTGAIRQEYGDAGLGPVVAFLSSWSLLAVHRLIAWEVPILGWRFALVRYATCAVLPFFAGFAARALSR